MSSLEKHYWRGPEECHGDGNLPPPDDDGLSRRRWLQLMGASLALAGAGGCRWEKTELLPFTKRPLGRTPGKTEKFATAMELGGSVLGLLVTCVDGRPIKIEGNPKHPYSLGATNAYAQASILELYDPDRSKNLIERTPEGEQVRTWDEFAAFAKKHFGELRKTGGEGFAVLAEPSSSRTIAKLRGSLLGVFPKAKWYEYDPIEMATCSRIHYALDKADVIVSIDADLFGTHPAAVRHAHDFAKRRDPANGKMSRLYVIESCYTITGAMADHRLALRDRQVAGFVGQLVKELSEAKPRPPKPDDNPAQRFLRALAQDIRSHQGKCAFVVGPQQPAEVLGQIQRLNASFGKVNESFFPINGSCVSESSPAGTIESLASSINAGGVGTLLVLAGNPAYNAPVDLRMSELLARVKTTVHLGLYQDETTKCCTWHLPQAHFLESWGDVQAENEAYSVVQPMIEPLYSGKSAINILSLVLDMRHRSDIELLRDQFRLWFAAEFESGWRNALHDGIIQSNVKETEVFPNYGPLNVADIKATSDFDWDGRTLELIFCPDSKLYDGRFTNNGWLQEFPDPLTKITWDNAATMSLATAEKLGVKHEDVVKLKFKGREVEAPVYVMPGQADGTVAVTLGYGRTAAGKVGGSTADGIAPVGFDAYKLRTTDAMWFGTGLTVEPTGKKHRFATTHDRYWIDKVGMEGRAERIGELVREMTAQEGRGERGEGRGTDKAQSPKSKIQNPSAVSLWQEPEYKGRRWGMTIDLSKCVGCGACVVACQAENNIPVVGKERVLRGREMHWLRVDRYFVGDPSADGTRSVPATEGPRVVFQPLPCQQCEMAPCEQVCPVGATTHSKEGLNDMAYNRCIGVRYCANNCPFKVRRFNYFNYHKDLEDPANEVMKMAYNPEVTVRSRGVMEKCTYCVQRIQAAKIEAKNHRQATIPDGQIKTACQQVCPAQAIIFGDLNDRESEVAKQLGSPRAYHLLDELNLKPRTSYLTRIRNPNPELEVRGEGRGTGDEG